MASLFGSIGAGDDPWLNPLQELARRAAVRVSPGVIPRPSVFPAPTPPATPPATPSPAPTAAVPPAAPGGGVFSAPQLDDTPPAAWSRTAASLPINTNVVPQSHGFFDRIGNFLNSDEGRAALLRSGAATINNGIGAGIEAGANYIDQRHAALAARDQALAEMGMRQRQLDIQQQEANQTGGHYANQDRIGYLDQGNKATANDIAAYRAKVDAQLRAQGIKVDWAKIDQDNTNNLRNNATQQRGQDLSYDSATRGQDMSRDTAIRGQDNQRFIEDAKLANTTGTRTQTQDKKPAQGGGFFGTPTPAETTTTTTTTPNYGEIRVDPRTGKKYRLDAFTGRPVLVP